MAREALLALILRKGSSFREKTFNLFSSMAHREQITWVLSKSASLEKRHLSCKQRHRVGKRLVHESEGLHVLFPLATWTWRTKSEALRAEWQINRLSRAQGLPLLEEKRNEAREGPQEFLQRLQGAQPLSAPHPPVRYARVSRIWREGGVRLRRCSCI